MIWPFHGRASEPETVPGNIKETNRIMRRAGFADSECSRYVTELRTIVGEILAKGGRVPPLPSKNDNLNNDARARLIITRTLKIAL